MLYNFLPNTLQYLLASVLWHQEPLSIKPSPLRFELRHEHAVSNLSRVVFSDIKPHSNLAQQAFEIDTRRLTAYRPVSQADFSSARFNGPRAVPWDEVQTEGPNIQDRESLLTLAKMTNNAYSAPTDKDWYDIGTNWNNVRRHALMDAVDLTFLTSPIRATPLDGSPTQTVSVVIYLPLQIILLWSSRSRVLLQDGLLAVADPQSRRTS